MLVVWVTVSAILSNNTAKASAKQTGVSRQGAHMVTSLKGLAAGPASELR
jgi:hypothetical protein